MTLGVSGLTLGLESPPDLSPRGAWGAEPNTLGIPGVTPRPAQWTRRPVGRVLNRPDADLHGCAHPASDLVIGVLTLLDVS
jgi:hypothetical protein